MNMRWILSNERRPNKTGDYYAEDTVGERTLCPFIDGHWHSDTGHPIAKWLDEEMEKGDVVDFIEQALNHYWHDANINLERKDLGDIEKKNYEFQLRKSKELMRWIENHLPKLKQIGEGSESGNVVVVWKDGTYKAVNKNESWEFENDENWLVTISEGSGNKIEELEQTIANLHELKAWYKQEIENLQGSESYWKKRCLLSEEMYEQLNLGEKHSDTYTAWQQLKSSIGEETEGQDELTDGLLKHFKAFPNKAYLPEQLARSTEDFLTRKYTLIKKQ